MATEGEDVPPIEEPPPAVETVPDDVPAEAAPAEEAPAEAAPTDGAPADAIAPDEVPAEGVPEGEAPADGVPTDAMPAEGAPADGSPEGEVPADEVPPDEALLDEEEVEGEEGEEEMEGELPGEGEGAEVQPILIEDEAAKKKAKGKKPVSKVALDVPKEKGKGGGKGGKKGGKGGKGKAKEKSETEPGAEGKPKVKEPPPEGEQAPTEGQVGDGMVTESKADMKESRASRRSKHASTKAIKSTSEIVGKDADIPAKKRLSKSRSSFQPTESPISVKSSGSSSGSFSSSDEQVVKKKRPKGKKGKKGRRKSAAAFDEEDMERLERVTQPTEPSTIVEEDAAKPAGKPKKEKKKKGKKAKKEKKPKVVKTEAQLEEEAKARAEEERQQAVAAKKAAIAQEGRDLQEASLRGEPLEVTTEAMETAVQALADARIAEQATIEWEQYLECNGLPAPWDVPGMNTYLHLWEQEVYTVTTERSKQRTQEALELLHQLEDIIDDPFDLSQRRNEDWAWVAARFREFQAVNLEYCTYRLLRDIRSKMNRIDIPTADFRIKEELFSLCLWVSITLPTPTPNPRLASKSRIRLQWPEMEVVVMFPNSLKREMVAIRGMYTKYDHLSDTCSTFKIPLIPPYYTKTLAEACEEQLYCKMKYKFDNREIVKKDPVEVVQPDGTVVLQEQPEPELPPGEMPPKVPYQKLDVSPSLYCLNVLTQEMSLALQQLDLQNEIAEVVLNLRKYTILGGIFYLDLFYQPPQPQGMVSYEVFISTLTAPYSLQVAPFEVVYQPPPPIDPGSRRTPEEIEEDLLQQERELDELILLQIILPTHVYWLEPPMVVQWDTELAAWTTHTIFDMKYHEEKGYVTFRTGIFRPMALATPRWINLPYQAWEIRPEKDGTVTFQLSCAILTLEFHAKEDTICLKDIQSAPNNAFDPHLNVYYRFSKLRKIMKSIGIDVFPFFDTVLFVESACEKYWPIENNLYFCMAYLSVLFNMTWSRWNMTLDHKNIVFQMRIFRFDRPKQGNFDTVLVNMDRTMGIECTEVSPEFSDAPVEGTRFFADLWHMVRSTATKADKTRIINADQSMVRNLYRLYKNVRFHSFS